MSFVEKMEKEQTQYSENGALMYDTTGSALLDLTYKIPSLRNGIDTNLFDKAMKDDAFHALKWLLYLRDIKEGSGERKSFREYAVYLCNNYSEYYWKAFLKSGIDNYGRWDDYIYIAYNSNDFVKKFIYNIISKQLELDIDGFMEGKQISLLAKWLPSINASSKQTKNMAKEVCRYLVMDYRTYRVTLASLREYLKVVEVYMSSNNWGEINYSYVPSKANLLYKDAFYEHDSYRRQEYLDDLKNGKAKINANSMFIHDIVHAYAKDSGWYNSIKDYDATLEEMWKAQNKMDGFTNTLVVRDGSGSMTCNIGNSSIEILDVADAISLYCAENNVGEFFNKIVTFSSRPKIVDVNVDSLHDKLKILRNETECSNTNIEAVFDLVLKTAVKNKLLQDELPATILVISDMEFDSCTYNINMNTLFEVIGKKYEHAGYKLPKLVFWNVGSRTNAIPITENEHGVILLGGFNKNLLEMVMSSELDPVKVLLNKLDSARYDTIKLI